MFFSCHQRQEKNEKKRRSRGRGAKKLGIGIANSNCLYGAEFYAILSPLRIPLSSLACGEWWVEKCL